MREKINVFKVLSEPNRVRILMMLLQKPLCVCEITSILGLSTATVSKHLSLLKNGGFIEDEKKGKWINYKIIEKIESPIVKSIIVSLPEWFSDEKQILEDQKKVQIANRFKITCG